MGAPWRSDDNSKTTAGIGASTLTAPASSMPAATDMNGADVSSRVPWRRGGTKATRDKSQCHPYLVPSDNEREDEKQPKLRIVDSNWKDDSWLSSSEHHGW